MPTHTWPTAASPLIRHRPIDPPPLLPLASGHPAPALRLGAALPDDLVAQQAVGPARRGLVVEARGARGGRTSPTRPSSPTPARRTAAASARAPSPGGRAPSTPSRSRARRPSWCSLISLARLASRGTGGRAPAGRPARRAARPSGRAAWKNSASGSSADAVHRPDVRGDRRQHVVARQHHAVRVRERIDCQLRMKSRSQI